MLCPRHLKTLTAIAHTFRPCAARHLSTAEKNNTNVKPLSQFQQRKVLQEFDSVYDRNRDGFICKEDIDDLKRTLNQYYFKNRGEKIGKSHIAGYEDYWTLFTELADVNHDGKLSRKEWVDMWSHINDQAKDVSFLSLPMWVRLMPASLFHIVDIKGDGIMDFEEYQHFWYYLARYDCKYTRLRSIFNILTEDGTRKIDIKRFEELYADYYLSKDPATPGRYIAGPVEQLSEPKWLYV